MTVKDGSVTVTLGGTPDEADTSVDEGGPDTVVLGADADSQ